MICMAESYPPANTVESYKMKHPRDYEIDTVLLPGKNGVVHIISGASLNDSGEYECTVMVTLEEYSTPLQSDNVFTNLKLYGEFFSASILLLHFNALHRLSKDTKYKKFHYFRSGPVGHSGV